MPLHGIVFRGMLEGIRRAAERLELVKLRSTSSDFRRGGLATSLEG